VILGLDVRGDSTMRAVAADGDGSIVDRLPASGGGTIDASDVCAFGRAHAITAIGAASQYPHDRLPADLMTRVSAEFAHPAPPRVIGRGTALALAEQWSGAARNARCVVALAVDDSVHAGLALDGRPFEGAHGYAGAVGWMSLNPVEREDYRRSGGLESEIGTAGIVKRLIWRVKAGDESSIVKAVNGDLAAITLAHVFEHARSGDAVSGSVVRDTARYVGMAIANIATVVDPDVMVVGGNIADAADLLLAASRAEAVKRLAPAIGATLIVTAPAHDSDAVPLGAARAALLSA
jgi:predicted NBD/HSP70 family sugar kinase